MKITTLPQKLILSLSTLGIGIIIGKSISLSLYTTRFDNLSNSWWIWIVLIIVQSWLQLKIWDKSEISFGELSWLKDKVIAFKGLFKGFTLPKVHFTIPPLFLLAFIIVIVINLYLNNWKNTSSLRPQFTASKKYTPVTMSKELAERIRKYDSIHATESKSSTLVVNASGSSSAVLELSSTNAKRYTTDGHGKSQGLLLSIQYPSDYTEFEVDRPSVLVKLSSPNSVCEVNILVKKYPYSITSEQKGLALSDNTLEKTAKAMGLAFLSSGRLTINSEPAAYIDTYTEQYVQNSTFRVYKRTYYTYHKNYALEAH